MNNQSSNNSSMNNISFNHSNNHSSSHQPSHQQLTTSTHNSSGSNIISAQVLADAISYARTHNAKSASPHHRLQLVNQMNNKSDKQAEKRRNERLKSRSRYQRHDNDDGIEYNEKELFGEYYDERVSDDEDDKNKQSGAKNCDIQPSSSTSFNHTNNTGRTNSRTSSIGQIFSHNTTQANTTHPFNNTSNQQQLQQQQQSSYQSYYQQQSASPSSYTTAMERPQTTDCSINPDLLQNYVAQILSHINDLSQNAEEKAQNFQSPTTTTLRTKSNHSIYNRKNQKINNGANGGNQIMDDNGTNHNNIQLINESRSTPNANNTRRTSIDDDISQLSQTIVDRTTNNHHDHSPNSWTNISTTATTRSPLNSHVHTAAQALQGLSREELELVIQYCIKNDPNQPFKILASIVIANTPTHNGNNDNDNNDTMDDERPHTTPRGVNFQQQIQDELDKQLIWYQCVIQPSEEFDDYPPPPSSFDNNTTAMNRFGHFDSIQSQSQWSQDDGMSHSSLGPSAHQQPRNNNNYDAYDTDDDYIARNNFQIEEPNEDELMYLNESLQDMHLFGDFD